MQVSKGDIIYTAYSNEQVMVMEVLDAISVHAIDMYGRTFDYCLSTKDTIIAMGSEDYEMAISKFKEDVEYQKGKVNFNRIEDFLKTLE